MISKSNKRILIALYHDYHLFGYFENLVPRLLDNGYDVTLLTCDAAINDRYLQYCARGNFTLNYSPVLRVILRMMEYAPLRPWIWLYGWGWSFCKTRFIDAVFVPRDSKPFQYLIGYWKPNLVCQPGLATDDKHFLRYLHGNNNVFPLPQVRTKFKAIDKTFGGSYLSPVRGKKSRKFYSVVGEDFKEFYFKIGAIASHVRVSGNPNYEGVLTFSMSHDEREKLIIDLGVDSNKPLYVFFASQLYFSEKELSCLKKTIEKIGKGKLEPTPTILIKSHPRMSTEEIVRLEAWASAIDAAEIKIITHLVGEVNNMRLINIADIVLIEDSNVGILAALLDTPLMIMNLSNKPLENIYCLYSCIIDISNLENIPKILKKLKNHEARSKIIKCQHDMLAKISSRAESPNKKIVEILDDMCTADRS